MSVTEASLGRLTVSIEKAVSMLMDKFAKGEISAETWLKAMEIIVTRASVVAAMLGEGTAELSRPSLDTVVKDVGAQVGYLKRFYIDIVSSREYQAGWNARARQYAKSIKVPYWKTRTKLLPLPAMPAQGTQCGNNCGCSWDVKEVKRGGVTVRYNCYWVRGKNDSCQTCIQRARNWSPYVIDLIDGMLVARPTMGMTLKHLAGQHDQMSHAGGRGRKLPAAARDRAAIEADLKGAKKAVSAKMAEAKKTGDYSGMSQLRKRVKEFENELSAATGDVDLIDNGIETKAEPKPEPKKEDPKSEPVAVERPKLPKGDVGKAIKEAFGIVDTIEIGYAFQFLNQDQLAQVAKYAQEDRDAIGFSEATKSRFARLNIIESSAKAWIEYNEKNGLAGAKPAKEPVRAVEPKPKKQAVTKPGDPLVTTPAPKDFTRIDSANFNDTRRAADLPDGLRERSSWGVVTDPFPDGEVGRHLRTANEEVRNVLENTLGYRSTYSGKIKVVAGSGSNGVAFADWNGDAGYSYTQVKRVGSNEVDVPYNTPRLGTVIHEQLHFMSNIRAKEYKGRNADVEEGLVQYLSEQLLPLMTRVVPKYPNRNGSASYASQKNKIAQFARYRKRKDVSEVEWAATLLRVPAPERPKWIRDNVTLEAWDSAWELIGGATG